MSSNIGLSPEEKIVAVARGLIVVDRCSHAAKQARKKLMQPALDIIARQKKKTKDVELRCEELERTVYLRDQRIERMREEIEAKINEVLSLRNDANASVCDAAIEAFKECMELFAVQ